jgi:hypothetical protein
MRQQTIARKDSLISQLAVGLISQQQVSILLLEPPCGCIGISCRLAAEEVLGSSDVSSRT